MQASHLKLALPESGRGGERSVGSIRGELSNITSHESTNSGASVSSREKDQTQSPFLRTLHSDCPGNLKIVMEDVFWEGIGGVERTTKERRKRYL